MGKREVHDPTFEFHPLTKARWQDFETLFGPNGAVGGCWCSLAPRQAYPALDSSIHLKKVDEKPVWSIVCFYIHRRYRRHGLSLGLIQAAIGYARQQGAQILEAYPLDPRQARLSSGSAYTGLAPAFIQCGFVEVARRSPRRPILRYTIQ